MTCPICDQKPANCDCTETERRQYSEIADMEELVDLLNAKVAAMRLTAEELHALERATWVLPRQEADIVLAVIGRLG